MEEAPIRPIAALLARIAGPLLLTAILCASCDGQWCPPESRCGARCVDLETDDNHCGACDVRCVHPVRCVDGSCRAGCPPTHHDGGDGSCVPRGTCSEGHHDGGDGACVPEGECRAGYRDGGDGTCYPQGACSEGFHDGGDGSCVPSGSCAGGFELTRLGRCASPGACSLGIELQPAEVMFGRARPGQSRFQLIAIQPAQDADECAPAGVVVGPGSASAFGILEELPLPDELSAGESAYLLLSYQPTSFGSHSGRLVATVEDPLAPVAQAQLIAEAISSPVTIPNPLLRVEGLAVGATTGAVACMRNEGATAVIVERIDLEWRTEAVVQVTPAPSHAVVAVAPGGELCASVEIRPTSSGVHGGTISFVLRDGNLPLVMLLLGSTD